MGHMPQPRFDFQKLIETAPALLTDKDIIELVHGPAELRDQYIFDLAQNLVEHLPVDKQAKDRICAETIINLSYAMEEAFDGVFCPHVEETSMKSLPRIVLQKTDSEIRKIWIAKLEKAKDYAAEAAWTATTCNDAPDRQIS